jgi:hypothetical protein
MSLLSDIERERLIHRPHDAKTRASNDVRIRKKLRAWIHELDDVALICEYLPEDQINKEIVDNDVYFLMGIARSFMKSLKFFPMLGRVDHPEEWKTQTDTGAERSVTDEDIDRSLTIKKIIDDIIVYHGQNNPIDSVLILSKMASIPELQSKVTEADRRSLERLQESLINFTRYIHKRVDPDVLRRGETEADRIRLEGKYEIHRE